MPQYTTAHLQQSDLNRIRNYAEEVHGSRDVPVRTVINALLNEQEQEVDA